MFFLLVNTFYTLIKVYTQYNDSNLVRPPSEWFLFLNTPPKDKNEAEEVPKSVTLSVKASVVHWQLGRE